MVARATSLGYGARAAPVAALAPAIRVVPVYGCFVCSYSFAAWVARYSERLPPVRPDLSLRPPASVWRSSVRLGGAHAQGADVPHSVLHAVGADAIANQDKRAAVTAAAIRGHCAPNSAACHRVHLIAAHSIAFRGRSAGAAAVFPRMLKTVETAGTAVLEASAQVAAAVSALTQSTAAMADLVPRGLSASRQPMSA